MFGRVKLLFVLTGTKLFLVREFFSESLLGVGDLEIDSLVFKLYALVIRGRCKSAVRTALMNM